MKIAAYCRVSTDKQEQAESLRHQKEFFTEFARRNGHELVGLYADEGISGTSLKKREAFKRLLLDAETGLFRLVVVKDISRFARNTVDALQSVRKLKALGISTVFLTANMDSMGDGEFLLTLFSAMAQEESHNLSKRVKWGKKINAEKGRVPPRVFGYDKLDNFTLAPNDGEARTVRKIFSLYVEGGLGCRTISMELNRAGDRTKMGGEWNARGVRRVLGNPLYCGKLVNHKYEVEDFLTGKQVSIPQEEQFVHYRPEWAIVSPEQFQRAQEIMAERRVKYDSGEPFRGGRYSGKHLFSTLIKCDHCGRSFTRKCYTYVNTRVYWRCVTNDQYTAQACENRVILDESELLGALRDYITAMIGDREAFMDSVLAGLEDADPAQDRAVLEARRKRLQVKRDRYQEMYAGDLISMPELKEKLNAIAQELNALQAEHEAITRTADRESMLPLRRREISRFLDFETVTNADLRQLVDHISVNKDGMVRVILKKLHEVT